MIDAATNRQIPSDRDIGRLIAIVAALLAVGLTCWAVATTIRQNNAENAALAAKAKARAAVATVNSTASRAIKNCRAVREYLQVERDSRLKLGRNYQDLASKLKQQKVPYADLYAANLRDRAGIQDDSSEAIENLIQNLVGPSCGVSLASSRP